MIKNVGGIDRFIRLVIAVTIAGFAFVYNIWWLYLIAALVLITSILGYCCVYRLFGYNTTGKIEKAAPIAAKPKAAAKKKAKKK